MTFAYMAVSLLADEVERHAVKAKVALRAGLDVSAKQEMDRIRDVCMRAHRACLLPELRDEIRRRYDARDYWGLRR
jgi:hypothetical protein